MESGEKTAAMQAAAMLGQQACIWSAAALASASAAQELSRHPQRQAAAAQPPHKTSAMQRLTGAQLALVPLGAAALGVPQHMHHKLGACKGRVRGRAAALLASPCAAEEGRSVHRDSARAQLLKP